MIRVTFLKYGNNEAVLPRLSRQSIYCIDLHEKGKRREEGMAIVEWNGMWKMAIVE